MFIFHYFYMPPFSHLTFKGVKDAVKWYRHITIRPSDTKNYEFDSNIGRPTFRCILHATPLHTTTKRMLQVKLRRTENVKLCPSDLETMNLILTFLGLKLNSIENDTIRSDDRKNYGLTTNIGNFRLLLCHPFQPPPGVLGFSTITVFFFGC